MSFPLSGLRTVNQILDHAIMQRPAGSRYTMIHVTCPQCNAVYHSETTHIGKHLRCLKCGCLVPISDTAARTAVEQPSAHLQNASDRSHRPLAARPVRHIRSIYAVAITASAIVLALSVFIRLRHSAAPTQHVADSSDTSQVPALQRQATQAQRSRPVEAPRIFPSTGKGLTPRTAGQPSAHEHRRTMPAQAQDERPRNYNSLPTGSRITADFGTNGHGTLEVHNGTSVDAVVRLYDAATCETIRWFSVQPNGSAKMTQIPEGTYSLAYTTGLDWIDSQDAFRWHPSYSQFERTLQYTERRDSEGVEYHDISITLHPVVGGNVRTRPISRDEFLKGHRHMRLQ